MMRAAGGGWLLGVGCLCLLSVSCGSVSPPASSREVLEARFERLGLDPSALVDPLELTDEMRAWARANVRRGLSEAEKLEALMAALTRKEGLAVRYEREFTGTAREVFESGEANCLSFTNLFVALARELDVDAYYLNIRRGPRYEQEGDLVVRWEHVTAGWDRGTERKVLEFGVIPESSYRTAVKLADVTALGMFYSNRGAESLLAGDVDGAREWLETAVAIAPEWSHSWLNLGVVRRRSGDLLGAEAAYREGIERDPDHLQLYANLAALLQARGEEDSVGELLALLDRRSSRNPFLYRSLGDVALKEGQLDDAHRFYRRALRLNSRDADTHAALGLWELAMSNHDRARSRLERAEQLDPDSERAARLRSRLEEIEAPPDAAPENLVRFAVGDRHGRIPV